VEFGYYTDVLRGGLGADKSVFSSIDDIGNSTIVGHAEDLITDFSPRVDNGLVDLSADGDQINLHPIDADERPSAPGNQDFSRDLIPEGEAFTAPGQISWLHQGGETWITLNTDADLADDATTPYLRVAHAGRVLVHFLTGMTQGAPRSAFGNISEAHMPSAAQFILGLHAAYQDRNSWKRTNPLLMEAAERGGSIEAATEQFELALFLEARYVQQ